MGSPYEVEVAITSAEDLKNVNWRHGKLSPYAVAWVDPNNKLSTRVDNEGDTAPSWNDTLIIPFDSPIEDSTLNVDIVHAGAAEDTKPLIGSAKLHLRDVVDSVGLGNLAERKLDLKRPSGRPQGKLEVKVSAREPRYPAPGPYYAPPYGVTRDYPLPPYGAPTQPYAVPPAGYPGAPPPIYGQAVYSEGGYSGQSYGQGSYYGQPGYEEEKKSKFGGMGTGLAVGAVAGALGGLALAEGVDALEDEVADDVDDDLGYDF